MLTGTVIENSLADKSILNKVKIIKSWKAVSWTLHKIEIKDELARKFGNYLSDGPWYVHFWDNNREDILVVFKGRIFDIMYSDKGTWGQAIEYGKSLGIPEEQLDFLIDQ